MTPVSLDSLTFLLGIYWPYMLGAVVIGLGSGWLSFSRPKN